MMLDINHLRTLVRYEPETGKLFWLPRAPVSAKVRSWNTLHAGKEALSSIDRSHGYRRGSLMGHKAYAHRVAFALIHGRWPKNDVDHLNGDRADNRAANIREATRGENSRNRRHDRRSIYGSVGVFPRGNRWKAQIGFEGRTKYLGMFRTKTEAVKARQEAQRALGFHANHGKQPEAGR